MTTALARGWGDPWSSTFRADYIVSVRVPHFGHVGHDAGIVLPVHSRVAPLFVGFLTEAQRRGYTLDDVADDWGYARRCVRGTGPGTNKPCVTSNHAWGLAVDINATRNPMGAPLRTDMPSWLIDLAQSFGLEWGGGWSRPDPMHFEFTGTPGEADALVARLRTPPVTWKWEDYMPKPLDVTSAAVCPGGGFWTQSAEGGVYAFGGAPWIDAYNAHAELGGGTVRYFVALVPTPAGGYVQIANDGATYRWDPR